MSTEHPTRDELLEALAEQGRLQSRATVLFHSAVADRLGLSPSDHKCLDLLLHEGPLSAGELAERTGLTSGAITGVTDRLERAGFVRRTHDQEDRRRVILCPVEDCAENEVSPLFQSLAESWERQCRRYRVEELKLILRFMRQTTEILNEERTKIEQAETEIAASSL